MIKKIVIAGMLLTMFLHTYVYAMTNDKSTKLVKHRNPTNQPPKRRDTQLNTEKAPSLRETIPYILFAVGGAVCGGCFYYAGEDSSSELSPSYSIVHSTASCAAGGIGGLCIYGCCKKCCKSKKGKRMKRR